MCECSSIGILGTAATKDKDRWPFKGVVDSCHVKRNLHAGGGNSRRTNEISEP